MSSSDGHISTSIAKLPSGSAASFVSASFAARGRVNIQELLVLLEEEAQVSSCTSLVWLVHRPGKRLP